MIHRERSDAGDQEKWSLQLAEPRSIASAGNRYKRAISPGSGVPY